MGFFDKFRKKKAVPSTQKSEDVKVEKEKKVVEKKADKKKVAKPKKEEKKALAVSVSSSVAHKVLLQPVLSEKSFKMQAENKYVFRVAPDTNKYQIRTAIKELYGVSPIKVNVIRKQPVAKYRWGKTVGKTKLIKKALVTMPEGTVLNLTE